MTPDEIRRRVAEIPWWYHKIDLGNGIVTPGWAPINADAYHVPADLTGKYVLDVGAWDGYWTFEALKRGARQVIAIDDWSDMAVTGKEKSDAPRTPWDSFNLCREALGYDGERLLRKELSGYDTAFCRGENVSVYDLRPEKHNTFDIIFAFGLLYHCRHPLLALDRLSDVCPTGDIYIESAILDQYSPYRDSPAFRPGEAKGYPGNQMVMEFYPGTEYGANPTNWWVPTLHCLEEMVRAAGWDTVTSWKLTEQPQHMGHCRGFVQGSKTKKGT
jgi:tRNA (mo5U34)-methyltransferase